jgi:hypothetical protein
MSIKNTILENTGLLLEVSEWNKFLGSDEFQNRPNSDKPVNKSSCKFEEWLENMIAEEDEDNKSLLKEVLKRHKQLCKK